tara:strand:- start:707 stop:841 length:135 start_codon:yes stop_codon:yes gene_type:complete
MKKVIFYVLVFLLVLLIAKKTEAYWALTGAAVFNALMVTFRDKN